MATSARADSQRCGPDSLHAARMAMESDFRLVNAGEYQSRTDAELVNLYVQLKNDGHLSGSHQATVRQELNDLLAVRVKKLNPELSDQALEALTLEDRLSIIEAHLVKPGVRPNSVPPPGAVPPASLGAHPAVVALQEKFAVFNKVTPADNRAFIAAGMTERPGVIVVWNEKVILKQGNTFLPNFNVNTALSNQHNEFLLEAVLADPELKKRLIGKYYDFKALGFMFKDADNPMILEHYRAAYAKASRQFAARVNSGPLRDLVRNQRGIAADPASWHLAGVGKTIDEAGAMAGDARSFHKAGEITPIMTFAEREQALNDRVVAIEQLRRDLIGGLPKDTGITAPANPNASSSPFVLSERAFELLRKVEAGGSLDRYVAIVQEKFLKRFKVNITREQAIQLRDYHNQVNAFSARLLTHERQVVDLAEAEHDIIYIDVTGLGAAGTYGDAGALAEARGSARAALRHTRAAEQRGTDRITAIEQHLDNSTANFFRADESEFSPVTKPRMGDDKFGFTRRALKAQERVDYIRRIAETPNATLRVTLAPTRYWDGTVIPTSVRWDLGSDGDRVIKAIRDAFEGKVSDEVVRQITVGLILNPRKPGSTGVAVVVAGKVDKATEALVRETLPKVLPPGFFPERMITSRSSQTRLPAVEINMPRTPIRRDAIPPPARPRESLPPAAE